MEVQDRRLALVVGPGRSGTSMIAGMLRRVGWYIPQPEFPGSKANPRGYCESRWVYNFHETLLRSAGVRYISVTDAVEFERCASISRSLSSTRELRHWLDRQFRASSNNAVLIKDPRTVCFAPTWLSVCDSMDLEVFIVSMIREPLEVIGSQNHYYHPPDESDRRLRAWTLTALYGEYVSRSRSRAFILFKDLIADPAKVFVSLDTVLPPGGKQSLSAALEFVDPELYRIKGGDRGGISAAVLEEAYSTLGALVQLSEHPGSGCEDAENALDGLRRLAGF